VVKEQWTQENAIPVPPSTENSSRRSPISNILQTHGNKEKAMEMEYGCKVYSPNSTRPVTSRHDTFDVSSRAVRQARRSQNAWARQVERVVSRRDDPSGIWAYAVIMPAENVFLHFETPVILYHLEFSLSADNFIRFFFYCYIVGPTHMWRLRMAIRAERVTTRAAGPTTTNRGPTPPSLQFSHLPNFCTLATDYEVLVAEDGTFNQLCLSLSTLFNVHAGQHFSLDHQPRATSLNVHPHYICIKQHLIIYKKTKIMMIKILTSLVTRFV